MLLNEVLDMHSDVDADVLVEHLEAAMVLELFGGLRGVAGAAAGAIKGAVKGAATTARNAYNDGEVKTLLTQLDKYKQQLRGLIQNNPHAFSGNQAAQPAQRRVDPSLRQAVRADQISAKQQAQGPRVAQPLSNIARREQQAGSVYPARRRLSGNDLRKDMESRDEQRKKVAKAAAAGMQAQPQTQPRVKPHIKLKAPRPHMEGYVPDTEILNELLGGLGGVFGAAKGAVQGAVKGAVQGASNSYAKGEAKIILNKMIDILSRLKERGYQPPPELLRDFKTLQQAAQ
jgi:hypothetical protein